MREWQNTVSDTLVLDPAAFGTAPRVRDRPFRLEFQRLCKRGIPAKKAASLWPKFCSAT